MARRQLRGVRAVGRTVLVRGVHARRIRPDVSGVATVPAGGCSGRSIIRAELHAAPGSSEYRLRARTPRRYRSSSRPRVGIGRLSPSECTPREGPGRWQGVWFGHVPPICPNPNPKR